MWEPHNTTVAPLHGRDRDGGRSAWQSRLSLRLVTTLWPGLYVSLTHVKTSDQPIENATIVAEEMLRWFREMEGFEGLLMLSKEGTTLGLTFWESREVAERHRVARMQFRDRMTSAADVQVEQTDDYEVTFAHLNPRLTDFSK
jgi:hypothetical protein